MTFHPIEATATGGDSRSGGSSMDRPFSGDFKTRMCLLRKMEVLAFLRMMCTGYMLALTIVC